MAQSPKKRYKVPKDIASRTGHDIMEIIFGKRVVKKVDSLVEKNSKDVEKKGDKSTTEEL